MKSIGNKKDLVPFVIKSASKIKVKGRWMINDIEIDSFFMPGSCKTITWTKTDISKELGSCPGTLVNKLSFADLIFDPNCCNGIYIFYDGEKCAYVGKCSSRTIVERVGSHLAPRYSDFMNSLLKRIFCDKGYKTSDWDSVLKQLYDEVLKMTIKYIPVTDNSSIGVIERRLIDLLSPKYNK